MKIIELIEPENQFKDIHEIAEYIEPKQLLEEIFGHYTIQFKVF
jgi:hypothetical protein